MFRLKTVVTLLVAVLATRSAVASTSLTEDFSTSPFGAWTFGIGDNSNNKTPLTAKSSMRFMKTNCGSRFTGSSFTRGHARGASSQAGLRSVSLV